MELNNQPSFKLNVGWCKKVSNSCKKVGNYVVFVVFLPPLWIACLSPKVFPSLQVTHTMYNSVSALRKYIRQHFRQ